mgnify:FL=1
MPLLRLERASLLHRDLALEDDDVESSELREPPDSELSIFLPFLFAELAMCEDPSSDVPFETLVDDPIEAC